MAPVPSQTPPGLRYFQASSPRIFWTISAVFASAFFLLLVYSLNKLFIFSRRRFGQGGSTLPLRFEKSVPRDLLLPRLLYERHPKTHQAWSFKLHQLFVRGHAVSNVLAIHITLITKVFSLSTGTCHEFRGRPRGFWRYKAPTAFADQDIHIYLLDASFLQPQVCPAFSTYSANVNYIVSRVKGMGGRARSSLGSEGRTHSKRWSGLPWRAYPLDLVRSAEVDYSSSNRTRIHHFP